MFYVSVGQLKLQLLYIKKHTTKTIHEWIQYSYNGEVRMYGEEILKLFEEVFARVIF